MHKQQPVPFITVFSSQEKVEFGRAAWVCWWFPSLPGGPRSLDSVARGQAVVPLAFSFFTLGAGIRTSSDFYGCTFLQPERLNIVSSPPHLLCGILSSDSSFCLFHIRTCAVCSLRSSEITSANKYFMAIRYLVSVATCSRSGHSSLCSLLEKGETHCRRRLSNLGLKDLKKTKRKAAQVGRLGCQRHRGQLEGLRAVTVNEGVKSGSGWSPIWAWGTLKHHLTSDCVFSSVNQW